MLESGMHDAYVIDACWETDATSRLTLDIAVTQGAHRGELVTISVPASTTDGTITPDLIAVCNHFNLPVPAQVPSEELELALLAMPCTLISEGTRIGFAISRGFDERETDLDA